MNHSWSKSRIVWLIAIKNAYTIEFTIDRTKNEREKMRVTIQKAWRSITLPFKYSSSSWRASGRLLWLENWLQTSFDLFKELVRCLKDVLTRHNKRLWEEEAKKRVKKKRCRKGHLLLLEENQSTFKLHQVEQLNNEQTGSKWMKFKMKWFRNIHSIDRVNQFD